jgi:YVTN family beta-propeller protein
MRLVVPTGLLLVLTAAALAPASAATLVVANKAEATASLIDLGSGEVVATLPTGAGPHEVGISPDGARALVTNYATRDAEGSTLTLIDVGGAEVLKTIDLGEHRRPHGVEWLDGRRAAVTAEASKALLVVDVEAGEVVDAIDTAQEVSHMVALAPDGRHAYVANIGSGSATVIDLSSGTRLANVATGDGAEGIAVAAGGGQVWVTNRAADTVTVLDPETLKPLAELASPGFPIRATAAGGRVLVTRARAGDMVIYDAAKLAEEKVVKFDLKAAGFEGRLFGDRFGESSVPIGVVVDGDGERAWVAHANADVITEVDLDKGAITRLLKAGREPDGMGYSPVAVKSP